MNALPFPEIAPVAWLSRGQTASRLPHATLLASSSVNDVTVMLRAAQDADPQVAERLLPLVYEELRRAAQRRMAMQPPGQTLQATALVHEAFLKLTTNPGNTWANRRHFFAAASEAMRHILVDRARRKAAIRHGGDQVRLPLEELLVAGEAQDDHVIAVHDALARLAEHDAAAAELVQLRFFGGFTFAQAAELLGISERTAKRMWAYARAWLFEEIERGRDPAS